MQKKKEQASEELYGELGQAFNFTRGDLEANRAGFMSYRQQEILSQEINARVLVMQIPLFMSFVLLMFSQFNWGSFGFLNVVILFLVRLLFPSLVLLTIYLALQLLQEKRKRRVKAVNALKGFLGFYKETSQQQVKLVQELKRENNLRAYLSPKSNLILSVEPIFSQ